MKRNSQNMYGLRHAGAILSCIHVMCGCSLSKNTPSHEPDIWPAVYSASQVNGIYTSDLVALGSAQQNRDERLQEEFTFIPLTTPFRMTAYAAPVMHAKKHSRGSFIHPIRGLPEGVESDETLPPRSQINASYGTAGVIGWAENGLDAYLAEVNGSVKLQFGDGTTACLGWVRTNDLPYKSLGKMLAHDGHINSEAITLQAIRELYLHNPEIVHAYMLRNDRAVFFEQINCNAWPRASSGIALIPKTSVAVDPELIPLGSVLMIEGRYSNGTHFRLPVAAVDIGGAIKGPRLDLYIGDGDAALKFAGEQNQIVNVSILSRTSARE